MAMFKRTLIVDPSSLYIQQIIDMMGDLLGEVEYCFDGATALEKYNKFRPDLFFVEAILPRRDGLSVLEELLLDDIIKIMITSVHEQYIVKKAFDLKVDYLFIKPFHQKSFVERMKELAEFHKRQRDGTEPFVEGESFVRLKISNTLKELGVPPNVKGYILLREAIMITYYDFAAINSLNEKIYKRLAGHFSTNPALIERNIRHAIESSVMRADTEEFYNCFGYSVNAKTGKPTNGEFIAAVADRLILEHNITEGAKK